MELWRGNTWSAAFYRTHFNPYLNFHRPCGVPEQGIGGNVGLWTPCKNKTRLWPRAHSSFGNRKRRDSHIPSSAIACGARKELAKRALSALEIQTNKGDLAAFDTRKYRLFGTTRTQF
jgi:hypothetical protein